MNRIHKIAAVAAMAVSAAAFLAMVEPASAASHRAATDYCLQYNYGGSDCGFTNRAQCEATASGIGAECYRNDFGKEGETLQW